MSTWWQSLVYADNRTNLALTLDHETDQWQAIKGLSVLSDADVDLAHLTSGPHRWVFSVLERTLYVEKQPHRRYTPWLIALLKLGSGAALTWWTFRG